MPDERMTLKFAPTNAMQMQITRRLVDIVEQNLPYAQMCAQIHEAVVEYDQARDRTIESLYDQLVDKKMREIPAPFIVEAFGR